MRIHHTAVMTAVAAMFAGVAYGQPHIPVEAPEMHNDCPTAMRRALVSTRVINGGVEIELKTPISENLVALRQMVREAAMVIEVHSKDVKRVATDVPHDFPPVDIWVKDIGAGVRVRVLAERAKDIPELRALALGFEQVWLTSDCVDEPMEPYTGPAVSDIKATNRTK